jgi:limonene 1,2-monooxygenase
LHLGINWADYLQTKGSFELFARYVIPKINRLNDNRIASEAFLRANHDKFSGAMKSAVSAKIEEYVAEKGGANVAPALRDAFSA